MSVWQLLLQGPLQKTKYDMFSAQQQNGLWKEGGQIYFLRSEYGLVLVTKEANLIIPMRQLVSWALFVIVINRKNLTSNILWQWRS
jgi:hypothetical protein